MKETPRISRIPARRFLHVGHPLRGLPVFVALSILLMSASARAAWPFEHWRPYIPQLYTIAAGIDDAQAALVDAATEIKTFPVTRQQGFASDYDSTEGTVNLFYKSVEDAVATNRSVDWKQYDAQRQIIATKIKQSQAKATQIIDQNSVVNHQDQAALALSTLGSAISLIIGDVGDVQSDIDKLSVSERTAFVADVKNLEWKPWSELGQATSVPTQTQAPR
jgi:hypothetical protein